MDVVTHQNFDVFYQEHYNQVYWYIYRKINHTEDAQDLAGDVFCACYKDIGDYDPEKSSITTPLYTVEELVAKAKQSVAAG